MMQNEGPTKNTSLFSKIWGAIKAGLATVRSKISSIFGKWFGTKKPVNVPEQQQTQRASQDSPVEKPTKPKMTTPLKQAFSQEKVNQPVSNAGAPSEAVSSQAAQRPAEDDDTRRCRERVALKEKALVSIKKANELLGKKLPLDLREANLRLKDSVIAGEMISAMQMQIDILEKFCAEGSSYDIGDAKWILTQLNENNIIIEEKLSTKQKAAQENFQKIMRGETVPAEIDPNSELGKSVEEARQRLDGQMEKLKPKG